MVHPKRVETRQSPPRAGVQRAGNEANALNSHDNRAALCARQPFNSQVAAEPCAQNLSTLDAKAPQSTERPSRRGASRARKKRLRSRGATAREIHRGKTGCGLRALSAGLRLYGAEAT